MEVIKKYKKIILVLIAFVALSILCYLFPYVHDDWAWGSSIGLDRLNSGFVDYGGRYLGYLIVIFMTRYKILGAILMGGVLTGIGVCVKRLVERWWAFGATLILLFLIPREVFAQSVSWISGFANYATTTLVVLIFLNILKDIIFHHKKGNWFMTGVALLVGFCSSLILENVTVYLVVISIIAQIYLLIRERKFSLTLCLFSLGAIAGAALMFSNSAYHNVASGEDTYRSIATSITGLIARAKANYISDIYVYGLFKNIIINVVLAFGGIFVLVFRKINKKSAFISLGIFCIYVVYTLINEMLIGRVDKPNVILYIEGVLSFVALLALIIFSIAITKRGDNLRRIFYILWGSFFMLLAPLFFITPIGPRNFLANDLILIAVGMLWWKEALKYIYCVSQKIYKQMEYIGKRIELITAVSVWLIFVSVFAYITYADNLRLQNIKNEINEGHKTVTITTLPFESLMWCSTPRDDVFEKRYKLFYNLPEDIQIIVKER